jgi:aryl-alcohol dehydrogenase-like predicted oxidoreductase
MSGLPRVVLGCFNIGHSSDTSAKYSTPQEAQEFFDVFHHHGYAHLDTARSYSAEAPGTCEPLMASPVAPPSSRSDEFNSSHSP